ncbi:MAG: hypothetical protein ACYCZM_09295 [Acidimicrobiales bacterium]
MRTEGAPDGADFACVLLGMSEFVVETVAGESGESFDHYRTSRSSSAPMVRCLFLAVEEGNAE